MKRFVNSDQSIDEFIRALKGLFISDRDDDDNATSLDTSSLPKNGTLQCWLSKYPDKDRYYFWVVFTPSEAEAMRREILYFAPGKDTKRFQLSQFVEPLLKTAPRAVWYVVFRRADSDWKGYVNFAGKKEARWTITVKKPDPKNPGETKKSSQRYTARVIKQTQKLPEEQISPERIPGQSMPSPQKSPPPPRSNVFGGTRGRGPPPGMVPVEPVTPVRVEETPKETAIFDAMDASYRTPTSAERRRMGLPGISPPGVLNLLDSMEEAEQSLSSSSPPPSPRGRARAGQKRARIPTPEKPVLMRRDEFATFIVPLCSEGVWDLARPIVVETLRRRKPHTVRRGQEWPELGESAVPLLQFGYRLIPGVQQTIIRSDEYRLVVGGLIELAKYQPEATFQVLRALFSFRRPLGEKSNKVWNDILNTMRMDLDADTLLATVVGMLVMTRDDIKTPSPQSDTSKRLRMEEVDDDDHDSISSCVECGAPNAQHRHRTDPKKRYCTPDCYLKSVQL